MKKSCRTIFPLGMGVQKVEGSVIILNFLDTSDDDNEDVEIVASIAMPEGKARKLVEALNEALKEQQDAEDRTATES